MCSGGYNVDGACPAGFQWAADGGMAQHGAVHSMPPSAHSDPGSPLGHLPSWFPGVMRWVCSFLGQHLHQVWPGAPGELGFRIALVGVTLRKALLPAPKSTTRRPAQCEGPPRLSPGPWRGCPLASPTAQPERHDQAVKKGFLLGFFLVTCSWKISHIIKQFS